MSKDTLNLFRIDQHYGRGPNSRRILAFHGIPEEDHVKSFLKKQYFQVPQSEKMKVVEQTPRFGYQGWRVYLGPHKHDKGNFDITNLGNMLTDCADYIIAVPENGGKRLIYVGDMNGPQNIILQPNDKNLKNLTLNFHTNHAQYPAKSFEWISPKPPTRSELEILFKDAFRGESHKVREPKVQRGNNRGGYNGTFRSDYGSNRYDFHISMLKSDSIFTLAAGDWHPHLGRAYAFRTDTPIPIIASAADFHNQNKRQQRRA